MNRAGWSAVALTGLLLAGAAGVACGGGNASVQANVATGGSASGDIPVGSATADEDLSPGSEDVRAFHRHHHAMGFIGFALLSIPSLGVSPAEQAQVDKIRADIHAKMQPARDAEGALLKIVADGVAAGSIDSAKVDPAIAKIAEVSTQMDDVTNDAFNQLHAVLSGPERQALALKVQANWEVWHKANADESAHPDQEKRGGHIHDLTPVLGLSADQVQKIDAAFTASMAQAIAARKFDHKAAEAHMEAFFNAFASDKFDAKALTTADKANSGVTTWGATRMVKMYSAVTPVLTPDQRTKLANLLRDHATKTDFAGEGPRTEYK
jgi:Spy/CpxP family protein refolding chaperone